MEYGARNKIHATVKSVKRGDVMSLFKLTDEAPCAKASVLTTESVEELKLGPATRSRSW
jgi:molybdopterin-binding protein